MYCQNCGKQVQDNVSFCPFCGQKLSAKDSTLNNEVESQKNYISANSGSPSKRTSYTARNVAIATVIVIGVLMAILVLTVPGLLPGIGKPGAVTVSGTITATGTGAVPEKLTFISTNTGSAYVAACTGGNNPASYSISLPNGDTYQVRMTWQFLGFTAGTVTVGTLNLNTFDKSINTNFAG